MATGALAAIHLYPVKSCARIELTEVQVNDTGLVGDRDWQIVDADGSAVTQRTHPLLATVQPSLIDGGVELSKAGHGTVAVPRPTTNDRTVRALLGDEVAAADAGDEVAAWFSSLLDQPCRLVVVTDQTQRSIPQVPDQPLTFVDAGPVVVVNTASVDDLLARAKEPFTAERFRPNLIVDMDTPWAEDTWDSFSIGGATLTGLLPWPRCSVPQVDQESGTRTKEPAVALKAHRWSDHALAAFPNLAQEARSLFGIGCAIGPPTASLAVGDSVTVHSTKDPLIPPPPAL